MSRVAVRVCSAVTGLVTLAACSAGGAPAPRGTTPSNPSPAPAVGSCLHLTSARALSQFSVTDCATPHEGQVYALIGLPTGLTDPSAPAQLSRVRASLRCPDLKPWLGYAGAIPLGLLQTWRFPTKEQISAGARWTACVATRSPAADHETFTPVAGSLAGRLAGAGDPLPELGRCAPTHTNRSFLPEACRPGSKQWVWMGAHRKPAGARPDLAGVAKAAHAACDRLVGAHGGGAAFVYYPTTAQAWARSALDWSCWMPVPDVKR